MDATTMMKSRTFQPDLKYGLDLPGSGSKWQKRPCVRERFREVALTSLCEFRTLRSRVRSFSAAFPGRIQR